MGADVIAVTAVNGANAVRSAAPAAFGPSVQPAGLVGDRRRETSRCGVHEHGS